MKASIADALGNAKSKGMKMPVDDDDAGEVSASAEEVAALKVFERAKGPEEKAAALKAFIKLCGGY
jgi:hypothetical protein